MHSSISKTRVNPPAPRLRPDCRQQGYDCDSTRLNGSTVNNLNCRRRLNTENVIEQIVRGSVAVEFKETEGAKRSANPRPRSSERNRLGGV